jgi:hypothetical protein
MPTQKMKNLLKKINRKLFFKRATFQIVFPHVPKCAGNSVISSLRLAALKGKVDISFDPYDGTVCNLVGLSKSLPWWDAAEMVFAYKAITLNANILMGHAPFYQRSKLHLPSKIKIVTVLRNPIDRWISNYIYDSHKPKELGGCKINIDEYLNSGAAILGGNYYSVFFASANLQNITSSDIEQSIKFLKTFDLVGCTENIKAFYSKFSEICSMKIDPHEVNTSPKPGLAEEIRHDVSIMGKIKKLCANDIRVYEEVMSFWA